MSKIGDRFSDFNLESARVEDILELFWLDLFFGEKRSEYDFNVIRDIYAYPSSAFNKFSLVHFTSYHIIDIVKDRYERNFIEFCMKDNRNIMNVKQGSLERNFLIESNSYGIHWLDWGEVIPITKEITVYEKKEENHDG